MSSAAGVLYHPRTLALVRTRGFDEVAHHFALEKDDEPLITLTHPSNFLTEEEMEGLENCPLCVDGAPAHFASQRCESGGRIHCSCDTCF